MNEIVSQSEPHAKADPIEVGRLIRDTGLTPVIPESCPGTLASIMKSCWNIKPEKRLTVEQIIELLENNTAV